MATGDDQWLKEDGYLNVDTESVRIVYHPFLNVILVLPEPARSRCWTSTRA